MSFDASSSVGGSAGVSDDILVVIVVVGVVGGDGIVELITVSIMVR